jgi:hypothetical protein
MNSSHLLFFRPQILLLCLALSLLCSLPSYSQKPTEDEDVSDIKDGVTVVVDLAGKVEVIEMEGAKPKAAEKGARVPVGATFLVGPNSRLDLALSNGALFQLGENSKFTIGEFEQEAYEFVFTNGAAIRPREIKDFGADEAILQTMDASEEAWNKLGSEPTTSKGKFILSEGTMIGQSKKLKPGSRMEIVTPIGTAGIRGTVWMLTVKPVGGPGGTRFQGTLDVAEGRVDFGKTDGSRNVQVQGGYTATFDVTVTPSGEVRITNINTSPMPPERQAMLLGTISNVAQQQTYFTAVNGTPDALREAIRANAQTQAQGEITPAQAKELANAFGNNGDTQTLLAAVFELSQANPDRAAAIAAAATALAPAISAQIAASAASAAPAQAAAVAATVATASPTQAAAVAAAVATATPGAAVQVAVSVSKAVPTAALQIAQSVSSAVPASASAISAAVGAAVATGDAVDANPNQIGINDLPPVIPTKPIQPPPPAPAPTSTPTPPTPTPPSPTATPPPTPTPNPSNG